MELLVKACRPLFMFSEQFETNDLCNIFNIFYIFALFFNRSSHRHTINYDWNACEIWIVLKPEINISHLTQGKWTQNQEHSALWQVLLNYLKYHTFIALLLGKGGYNSAAINTGIHVLIESLQLLCSSDRRSRGECRKRQIKLYVLRGILKSVTAAEYFLLLVF